MLVVGKLIGRADTRLLLGIGLALTAWSFYVMTGWTPNVSQMTIIVVGVAQGIGLGFLFVPLRDLEAVRSIRFRLDVCERALGDFACQQVFVFTTECERAGSSVHSRMFAPMFGIHEDPATGSSTGPLAAYMMRHGMVSRAAGTRFVSEQGVRMGRRSLLHVAIDAEGGRGGIRVGGEVTLVLEGRLTV